MRVSYQHANVRSGNESTLLRFTTRDRTRACVLVDCGSDVDLDSLLIVTAGAATAAGASASAASCAGAGAAGGGGGAC